MIAEIPSCERKIHEKSFVIAEISSCEKIFMKRLRDSRDSIVKEKFVKRAS
jgi:hypothetical protein